MSDDWKVRPSQLAIKSANPIQRYLEEVKQVKLLHKTNQKFIDLSTATLCNPPDAVINCIIHTLNEGRHNGYAPSVGYEETRNAILSYLNLPNLTPKDVLLCSGVEACLDIAITALVERGQTMLVPKACNPIYKLLSHGIGVETIDYNLTPNWDVDLIDLGRKITSNTAVLLINNPHNPTGAVYNEDLLESLLNLAHRYRLPVIVDESYRDCVFPGTSFSSAIDVNNEMNAKVPMLVTGCIGKSFMVPGWRVGWILINDHVNAFEEVRKAVNSLSQRIIGCNTIMQGAICNFINCNTEFRMRYMNNVQDNAEYLLQHLNGQYGVTVVLGRSIYALVKINMHRYSSFKNVKEFCLKLYEKKGIVLLPGEVYNMNNYFRITLDAPQDIFHEAIKRLANFSQTYYSINV